MKNLYRVTSDGSYVEASTEEIVEVAKAAMNRKLRRGATLSSPKVVRDQLAVRLGTLEHEVFGPVLADTRHRVIAYVELFRGTMDGASVHPREVVKLALEKQAAVVILVHSVPRSIMGVMCP